MIFNESDDIAERVKAAYRSEELYCVDEKLIKAVGVEAGDAEFLCKVGVPRFERLGVSFNLIDSMPRLETYLRLESSSPPFNQVVLLNEKYGISIGMDLGRNGEIVCVDLEGQIPRQFVNSRVRYFVGFLAECVLHWKRWSNDGLPKEESYKIAEEWMKGIDSTALEPNTWWALIFEQMKAGLL